MPKGPPDEKRPADVIGAAVLDGGEPERGGVLAALRRAPREVAELELERQEIEPRRPEV